MLTVPPVSRLLDTSAVSDQTGIKVWTLLDLVRKGRIPRGVAVKIGHQVRWDPVKLAAWLAEGGNMSPPPDTSVETPAAPAPAPKRGRPKAIKAS